MTCGFQEECGGAPANFGGMNRRTFLKTGAAAAAAVTMLGPDVWRRAIAGARAGDSPYGGLARTPDLNGFLLPQGFTSRIIARSGMLVEGTTYPWHIFPDGGATFALPSGGWIYTSNSEVPTVSVDNLAGGASAIRFRADGSIESAYRILVGTGMNCAGGATPWGTWLSCEEHDSGLVWECDPTGAEIATPRLALGTFTHEAAVVDPRSNHVYLTEDRADSAFYRFTPDGGRPDLSSGVLEVMIVDDPDQLGRGGPVTWERVPNPNPVAGVGPTRSQVVGRARFNGGEGAWFDEPSRTVYFTTKGDVRVWAYHADDATIEVLYDFRDAVGSALNAVDNITVSPGGEMFICEDGGNMEICIITTDGIVAPFLRLPTDGSEMTGVAFDPSGTRMYFSSQRQERVGVTYEVTGPFRTVR